MRKVASFKVWPSTTGVFRRLCAGPLQVVLTPEEQYGIYGTVWQHGPLRTDPIKVWDFPVKTPKQRN